MRAIRQQVYSIEEVRYLDLLDSPFLMVYIPGLGWVPIQTSHMTVEEETSALAGTRWKYQRTTHEWIPLFYSVDSEYVLKNLLSCIKEEDGTYLLTPINYPFPVSGV